MESPTTYDLIRKAKRLEFVCFMTIMGATFGVLLYAVASMLWMGIGMGYFR